MVKMDANYAEIYRVDSLEADFQRSACSIFLYARLKNGTYHVTGYGVLPSVKFFISG